MQGRTCALPDQLGGHNGLTTTPDVGLGRKISWKMRPDDTQIEPQGRLDRWALGVRDRLDIGNGPSRWDAPPGLPAP